jgi:XTP/dITP diphosphohydrolase
MVADKERPDPTHRVVVATRNRGKLVEIRSTLAFPDWEFVTAEDLRAEPPDVAEDRETFVGNATVKASAYRDAFGLPALADDSGLCVDALGGDPCVRSARYAGEDASDSDNNAKLLAALAGVAPDTRRARFRCGMVYVDEEGTIVAAEGVCEGRIRETPRGGGGFGYDPLFEPDDAPGRTMAELSPEEKNAISHRGRALRALRERLALEG